MWTSRVCHASRNGRGMARLLVVAALAAALGGCGTVQFAAGRSVNTGALEGTLKAGVSTAAEVRHALGEPYGQGRALMPFQDSERAVWTYFHERGSVDATSGKMSDQRVYLFVFMKDDRFDGYMWFASELR